MSDKFIGDDARAFKFGPKTLAALTPEERKLLRIEEELATQENSDAAQAGDESGDGQRQH